MWITHSFVGTMKGDVKCLFFLLYEDYIEAQSGLPANLENEIERFARNLGKDGAVVKPFNGDAEKTRQHILDKPWSEDNRDELLRTPAMLMIDQDFDQFDPREHRYVILHLDGEEGDAAVFRSLFQKLVEALPDDESDPFDLILASLRNQKIAEASSMIELKPGVFGLNIDLKLAWKALKQFLREKK